MKKERWGQFFVSAKEFGDNHPRRVAKTCIFAAAGNELHFWPPRRLKSDIVTLSKVVELKKLEKIRWAQIFHAVHSY